MILVVAGGCGSGDTKPCTAVCAGGTSTPAAYTYVPQINTSSTDILQFNAGANGGALPVNTVTLPAGFNLSGMAVDSTGTIYAAGTDSGGASKVLVYANTATGTATPLRTLTLPGQVQAIALAGTSLYVLPTAGGLAVYDASSSGNVTAKLTIDGASTTLDGSLNSAIAVDASGNIYVQS